MVYDLLVLYLTGGTVSCLLFLLTWKRTLSKNLAWIELRSRIKNTWFEKASENEPSSLLGNMPSTTPLVAFICSWAGAIYFVFKVIFPKLLNSIPHQKEAVFIYYIHQITMTLIAVIVVYIVCINFTQDDVIPLFWHCVICLGITLSVYFGLRLYIKKLKK